MSNVDFSKPVQVLEDDGIWRDVKSPQVDHYIVSHAGKNGIRQKFYASPRHLRNTPNWRYFWNPKNGFMDRICGVDWEFQREGTWVSGRFCKWSADDYIRTGWIETDAVGNSIVEHPIQYPSDRTAELERLVREAAPMIDFLMVKDLLRKQSPAWLADAEKVMGGKLWDHAMRRDD